MSVLALQQAVFYHLHNGQYSKQEKFDAAVALGEFRVFSARQIGTILDLPHIYVSPLIGKKDKTGGRLPMVALKPLLSLAQQYASGEVDNATIVEVLDAGVTPGLAARLTGFARTTLMRRYDKTKEAGE